MNGRDYAQVAMIVLALLALMVLVIVSLSGCVTGTRADMLDEGRFMVDADCEKKRVKVELDLDRNKVESEVRVTK